MPGSILSELESAILPEEGKEPFELEFFLRQFERIMMFLQGAVVPPYEVEVQPSALCNAQCYFCWGEQERVPNRLTQDDNLKTVIQKIIEAEADQMGVQFVKFVGSTGDPLVNPKTLDAVDQLAEAGIRQRMFTNGIGLMYKSGNQPYAERLAGMAYLRVSLDAGSSETLYDIKKVKGFERIMEGIGLLRAAAERQNTGLFIHVGYVISDRNYHDILRAAQRVKDAGANGVQYRRDFLNPDMDPSMIEDQLAAAHELADASFIVTEVNDPEALCSRCYYPVLWQTVAADGCLYPCGHTALASVAPIGDLLQPGVSLMQLIQQQRDNAQQYPAEACRFCPPVALHASNLLAALGSYNGRPGFLQALQALHAKHSPVT